MKTLELQKAETKENRANGTEHFHWTQYNTSNCTTQNYNKNPSYGVLDDKIAKISIDLKALHNSMDDMHKNVPIITEKTHGSRNTTQSRDKCRVSKLHRQDRCHDAKQLQETGYSVWYWVCPIPFVNVKSELIL